MSIIAEERPRARKYHRCDHCQTFIAPGEVYFRQRAIWEGEPQTWKAHEDCAELAHEIWLAGSYAWDEGVTLHDEEPDDLAAWRGEYPHAVCRTELGWELAAQRYRRKMREAREG